MELSSPRFKSVAITIGISFWFFVFTSAFGQFSIENLLIFASIILIVTQIFALKLSKALNVFAIINTKIFLGMLFVLVISVYGILFKILRIDLLRLKNKSTTYWLETEHLPDSRIFKQY